MKILLSIGMGVMFIIVYINMIYKLGINTLNSAVFIVVCFAIIFIIGLKFGRSKSSKHRRRVKKL